MSLLMIRTTAYWLGAAVAGPLGQLMRIWRATLSLVQVSAPGEVRLGVRCLKAFARGQLVSGQVEQLVVSVPAPSSPSSLPDSVPEAPLLGALT
jgi:hypothetical protein